MPIVGFCANIQWLIFFVGKEEVGFFCTMSWLVFLKLVNSVVPYTFIFNSTLLNPGIVDWFVFRFVWSTCSCLQLLSSCTWAMPSMVNKMFLAWWCRDYQFCSSWIYSFSFSLQLFCVLSSIRWPTNLLTIAGTLRGGVWKYTGRMRVFLDGHRYKLNSIKILVLIVLLWISLAFMCFFDWLCDINCILDMFDNI